MPKLLTSKQIVSLARLARLRLTDAEIEKYKLELSEILDYINILDDADVDGLMPTTQVTGLINVLRDDVVADQPSNPDTLLGIAPDRQGRYIKVKRMI